MHEYVEIDENLDFKFNKSFYCASKSKLFYTYIGILITLIKIFNTFYTYHLKYSGKVSKDKLNEIIYSICVVHVAIYLVLKKLSTENILPFIPGMIASLMLPMNANNYFPLNN